MTLAQLARMLVDRPVVAIDLASVCSSENLSADELFDAIAREVALGFSNGSWSFADADAVMNKLFFYRMAEEKSTTEPAFFYSVFLAFDDGEHRHGRLAADADPVELYTRPALARILAGK